MLFVAGSLFAAAATRPQSNSPQASNNPSITLTSPLDYEVFQRRTRLQGRILVRGQMRAVEAHVPAERAEARLVGTSLLSRPLNGRWKRLSLDRTSGNFHGDLPTIAGGFYQVQVRLTDGRTQITGLVVPHVGVGEVFMIAGQSNATNYGEVRQRAETGMVTTFSGTSWRVANDPQPGVQDNSKKGSFIPSFGDTLYRKYHVPIGCADVGMVRPVCGSGCPKGNPFLLCPPCRSTSRATLAAFW